MREVRSFLSAILVGLIVLGFSLLIGNHDPLSLTVRAAITVVVIWVVAEIVQTQKARSHLPLVWVGFGSGGRKLAKESDEALAKRIDEVVAGISGITANHIRYQPNSAPGGGGVEEWQKRMNELQRHERDSAARIVEQHSAPILEIVSALQRRGTIDESEARSMVWNLQMMLHSGQLHDVPRIEAELTTAGRKLRGLD
jgi:hypothetical protein